jgi:hypothetical protein
MNVDLSTRTLFEILISDKLSEIKKKNFIMPAKNQ